MTALASYQHLRSRLHLALGLNAVIIAAEFAGGWLLNNIGLMSDAGHNSLTKNGGWKSLD